MRKCRWMGITHVQHQLDENEQKQQQQLLLLQRSLHVHWRDGGEENSESFQCIVRLRGGRYVRFTDMYISM